MKIAIAQRKGGVAKTATARELAVVLSSMGKSVLAIDCDPQHNLTSHLNVKPPLSLSGLLMTDSEPQDAIVTSAYGPDVIGADSKLAQVEAGMALQPDNKTIFAEVLEPVLNQYDVVIFDCPPQLGLLTANAINAADAILAPVSSDGEDSLGGLVMLMDSLSKAERDSVPIYTIKTRWQAERVLSRDIEATLEEMGMTPIGTVKESARLREAASRGPLAFRLPDNQGTLAYREIAEALVNAEVRA